MPNTKPPKLTDRIKAAFAGLKSGFNSGDWVSSNFPGNRYNSSRSGFGNWTPGTNIDYGSLAGDLWKNSMCQAILNWIIRAWPESYPCVKEMQKGKKVVVDDHPLTALLMNPNEFDDDTTLWGATILSFWCDGNAYWRINRTRGGQIGEFEYVPHWAISPYRSPGSTRPGPEKYILGTANGNIDLATWDVVHFRFGRDPENDMLGMSPWASVAREVYTDNEGVNYTASTLRNGGAAWMVVSPKDPKEGFADTEQIRDKIEEKTTGDNRKRVLVLDGAVDIVFPPSYKDMGMLDVRRIPESRAAALSGIPGMAVGFASAQERSTFANTEQAEAAAWNTIICVQRMMGRQLTKQVLWEPRNYNCKPNTIFAGFDYSEVRALQPDTQGEWERIGEAYDRGLLDEDEARADMGLEAFTPKQRAAVAERLKPAPAAPAAPKPGDLPAGSPSPGAGKAIEAAQIGVMIREQIAAGWRAG